MTRGLQLLVALLSVTVFVFCDYTITRWIELAETEGYWTWRLPVAAITAPLGAIAFGLVATRMGFAVVSALINTGIVVGGVLIGLVLRGDHLTNWQKTGVILGLLAMIFLCLGRSEADLPSVTE